MLSSNVYLRPHPRRLGVVVRVLREADQAATFGSLSLRRIEQIELATILPFSLTRVGDEREPLPVRRPGRLFGPARKIGEAHDIAGAVISCRRHHIDL